MTIQLINSITLNMIKYTFIYFILCLKQGNQWCGYLQIKKHHTCHICNAQPNQLQYNVYLLEQNHKISVLLTFILETVLDKN